MSYEQPPYGGFPPEPEQRVPWWKSTAFIISVCAALVVAMGIAVTVVLLNKDDSKGSDGSDGGTSSSSSEQTSSAAESSSDGNTSADAPGAEPSDKDSSAGTSSDPPVGKPSGETASTTPPSDESAMTVDEACGMAEESSGTWISTDPAWGISSGAEVLVATTLLGSLGYGPGPSTEFTDAHEQATMQYQGYLGVVADGVIGDDTWPLLIDEAC